jgi:hypothetical protein
LRLRRRLVLNIFPFPVNTTKLVAIYKTTGKACRQAFRASPILLCLLRCANTFLTQNVRCANTIGAAILTPLVGEAQRSKKNPLIFGVVAANAPCFACRRSKYALLRF